MKYYKFVSWDVPEFETVLNNKLPQALLEYDKGNTQPLKDLHIATRTALYKCLGWAIPYGDYLKKFWVKTKYNGIVEMYAMNRMDIRKELKSNVIKIMEVK